MKYINTGSSEAVSLAVFSIDGKQQWQQFHGYSAIGRLGQFFFLLCPCFSMFLA
jgi:hypothetical protein